MTKLLKVTTVALLGAFGTSCTTSYDAYGNTRQSVDPAGVAIGAVALGAIAYSVGKNRGENVQRRRNVNYNNQFYNQGWQRGGYRR